MDMKKLANVIAAAAAFAFVTAPIASTIADAATKIKCYGINKCKGKSQCKTASGNCKGKNNCKGQGYLMKTEKACKKLHGMAEAPANAAPTTK